MAKRTVTVHLEGDGSRFVALTGSGHSIVMDNADGDSGARPAELLVVALAGCTAMDVAAILRKKRQAFTRYEVRVAAEQRGDPPPRVFGHARSNDRARSRRASSSRPAVPWPNSSSTASGPH